MSSRGEPGADSGARDDAEARGDGESHDDAEPGRRHFEKRLEDLREEAARTGSVEGAGVHARGGPMPGPGPGRSPAGRPGTSGAPVPEKPAAGAMADRPGYYGQPVLKEPVWTWEIPVYFFVGGLAGMSAVIALGAHLTGSGPDLVRTALWIAVAGTLISAVLLIKDLGRPARFLTMLRVFKPQSPMSVGVWGLNAFGAVVTAAALLAQWGLDSPLDVLLLPALVMAATLGTLIATYTGVLLAATAIPAWNSHRALLPLHFGIAGLGSAAATLELLGFRLAPLHWIGISAASLETLVGVWVELHRHGPRDRALHEGRPGLLLRSSGLLAGPLSLVLRLVGWIPAAGTAFLLGALISRFGWISAGRASARDPEAALAPPD